MNFDAFEAWLGKLSKPDLDYLQKDPVWRKVHLEAQKNRSLPKGFVEKTMEILEGGSESET